MCAGLRLRRGGRGAGGMGMEVRSGGARAEGVRVGYPLADLEEEIPEAEFKKREGGVGSPTDNNVGADIEARVARTPVQR